MKHEINLKWHEKMAFEAEIGDYKIKIDAPKEVGGTGSGPTPKPLMLVSLAGCTAMDVVSILKKMRVEIEDLNIKVEGNVTEEHPKQYDYMKIIYQFKGKNLDKDKLEKAITLSQDRYCGVSALYKKAIEIDWEIEISE